MHNYKDRIMVIVVVFNDPCHKITFNMPLHAAGRSCTGLMHMCELLTQLRLKANCLAIALIIIYITLGGEYAI